MLETALLTVTGNIFFLLSESKEVLTVAPATVYVSKQSAQEIQSIHKNTAKIEGKAEIKFGPKSLVSGAVCFEADKGIFSLLVFLLFWHF